MSDIWDYSGTPSANTSLEGTNVAPGMSPANVDDAIRLIVAIMRNSLHINLETFLKTGGPLPLANGGTNATSAAAALTALGGLEDDYRDLPIVGKGGAFTFANADRGKAIIFNSSAAVATINPESVTSISEGAVFAINNVGPGVMTITRGAGVALKVNGSTVDSNATLAVNGVATLIRWRTDEWTISGSGLS